MKRSLEKADSPDCPYLDTVNRSVLDFDFEKSGGVKNKLVLVSWVPDESSPMSKMIYATTANSAKNSLIGIHKLVEVNDERALAYDNFVSKM